MNSTELYTVLGPVLDLKVEKVSEEATLQVDHDGDIFLQDGMEEWKLEGVARKSMLHRIKAPNAMVKKLSAPTSSRVMTELYQRMGATSALFKGNVPVSFEPKGRYRSVPIDLVVAELEQALVEPDYHRAMILPNHDVRLEVMGQSEAAVVPGDLVRGGVMVQFSPVGLTNPKVQSFALRLACTNGATSTSVIEDYSLGSNPDAKGPQIAKWIGTTAQSAYQSLPLTTAKWKPLTEVQVSAEDRPLLLGSLMRDSRLRPSETSALWAEATENPPETVYDVFNLMTWLSSHVLEDPERISRVQRVASNFVDEGAHSKFCPTCRRAG